MLHQSHDETRVLRDRTRSLDRRIGLAARGSQAGAARILLSVYDGGSIPTAADHVFLGHPVRLGGAEAEGVTPTQAIDT